MPAQKDRQPPLTPPSPSAAPISLHHPSPPGHTPALHFSAAHTPPDRQLHDGLQKRHAPRRPEYVMPRRPHRGSAARSVHFNAIDHVSNAPPPAVVPYAEPEKGKDDNDMSSTLSSTLPMAAVSAALLIPCRKTDIVSQIFTRNK